MKDINAIVCYMKYEYEMLPFGKGHGSMGPLDLLLKWGGGIYL